MKHPAQHAPQHPPSLIHQRTAASSTADVLALALAVARPGSLAMFINPDNTRGGWTSIKAAAESGRPFCVEPRPDTFQVDMDTPDEPVLKDHPHPEAEPVTRLDKFFGLSMLMRVDGYEPVVVSSGRPRHHHLFAVVTGDKRAVYEAMARDLGLRSNQRIRPPLSPHRLGLEVSLIEPTDPAAAIRALSPPAPVPPGPKESRPLSPKIDRLLREGDTAGAYPSRSEVVMAIVVGGVNAGHTADTLYLMLTEEKNKGGAKLLEIKREAQRRRYFDHLFAKATAWVAAHPAASDREQAVEFERLRAAAAARPWRGTTGTSDYRGMLAHISAAEQQGTSTGYQAGVRYIALKSGQGLKAVSHVNRRLCAAGLLRLEHKADLKAGLAARWSLVGNRNTPPTANPSTPPGAPLGLVGKGNTPPSSGEAGVLGQYPVAKTDILPPGADAFQPGGLPRNAWRVHEALGQGETTVKELAARLGLHRETVAAHLRRLRLVHLTESTGSPGRHRRLQVGVDLKALATALKVTGEADRIRARHAEQRHIYRVKARARIKAAAKAWEERLHAAEEQR